MDQGTGTIQNDPAAAPGATPAVGNTPGAADDLRGNDPSSTGDDGKSGTLTPEQQQLQRDADEKARGAKAASRIQERFTELSTTIKDKDRALGEKDALIAELVRGGKTPTQATAEVDPEPKRDDPKWRDKDYEEFLDARAEWKARKTYREEKAKDDKAAQARQQEERAVEEIQRTIEAHNKRTAEYIKVNPKFAEVLESDIKITMAAGYLLQQNEDGPLIMDQLHKQPELLAKLNGARNAAQISELLGRIAGSAKAMASQVSRAPAPGDPVGTNSSSEGDPPEDPEAYSKWANKKFGKQKR